jgi:hypothetical protein
MNRDRMPAAPRPYFSRLGPAARYDLFVHNETKIQAITFLSTSMLAFCCSIGGRVTKL